MPRRAATSETPARMYLLSLICLAVAFGAFAGCGGNQKGPPFSVETAKTSPVAGIQDDTVGKPGQDPTERLRKMAESGASLVRVDLLWSDVAPTRPVNPADPQDPAYLWQAYDRVLDVAKANKLEVMFAVYGTPKWARDPTVTPPAQGQGVFDFAVRPKDPADFGAFATAAATRFAPRGVRRWEGWNEPNIKLFLYPQFERRGDRWIATSPQVYSDLQKAFYTGVKSAAPNAIVAGGVTAPTGDRCGVSCRVARQPTKPNRIKADDFLMALNAPGLQPPMDVVSHHPYPHSGPRETTPPNRTYLDLYNLDVLTKTIDRTYLRGKKIWLSEYGFGTEAVDEYELHFTPQEQAAYIADAFERTRANPRVQLTVYYFLHDHTDWKSGLLDINGVPKPGLAAYALPLAIDAVTPKAVRLVGQARATIGRTKVQIEWKSGDTWRRLTTADTAADGTFAISVRPANKVSLRAIWDGQTRSGERVTWTSPEVAVPALAGP